MDFVSALFIEDDATALDVFFKNADALDAKELNQPGLVQSTLATIMDVRNSGSPVVEKAKLLTKGLVQWKRGRYGIGALGKGLLKANSPPNKRLGAARASDDSLRMPETTLAISQFLGSDSGSGYDRRHYYTWDLEERRLFRSYGSSSKSNTQTQTAGLSDWAPETYICSDGNPYTLSLIHI